MISTSRRDPGIELPGLDGSNPLGFLSALGVLLSLRELPGCNPRLRWTFRGRWMPTIDGTRVDSQEVLSSMVAKSLSGKEVSDAANAERSRTERAFNIAKKSCEDKRKEISKRGLKGNARAEVIEAELRPLELSRDASRYAWLQALAQAVPRPELALGKRIDCSIAEYRLHADSFRESSCFTGRESLDLLAAFGTDGCLKRGSEMVEPTPFCFIFGSGQQFFLDTVVQLIGKVSAERIQRALFEPWGYDDQKLSMRWDPLEDRRYALMDRDPTSKGNEPRTVWMANLLAYRALGLFSCAPGSRGLGTTAWRKAKDEFTFAWPIWEGAATSDVVRSLLQLAELAMERGDGSTLSARGISTILVARRIRVGSGTNYKYNFSPSTASWSCASRVRC